jgi:hypothetical protein
MERPNLDQTYETFIRIEPESNPINLIRFQIRPLIKLLRDDGIIDWFCFLIHNRESGVPTSEQDKDAYFHIRFDLKKRVDPIGFLPNYCVMTRKVEQTNIQSIAGINKSLLKDNRIEKAWRTIGEQSEWVLNMLAIYHEGIEVASDQIAQFLHFFFNMVHLGIKCPKCNSVFPF